MIPILALILLGCLVYSDSFLNSFHLDDFVGIVNNYSIRDLSHLSDMWAHEPTRFVTSLTFAFNYKLGGFNVIGFHLLNLMIHVATAVLVWQLINLISSKDRWLSFSTAAIFLVHPLATQSVNYLYQRGVLLVAFFYVLSLVLYIKSIQEKKKALYAASLLCVILSFFCKENAVSLPVMIVLYQWYFGEEEKFPWKRIGPYFLTLLVFPIVWLMPRLSTIKDFFHGTSNGMSVTDYALTQSRVILTYLKLLIVPLHQRIEYDYTLVTRLDVPTFLSISLIGALIAIAFVLRQRFRLMSFGVLWFFLTLMPESSFWPNNDLVYEHRAYLPLVGFAIFLSTLIFSLFNGDKRSVAIRILFIFLLVYSILTYQRNQVWRDELSLWDNTVHESPRSWRAYLNRGAAYQNQGDLDHALADYNMIIGLGRLDPIALSNRGLIFATKGYPDLAMANYNLAIQIEPSYMGAYNNRGMLYAQEGKTDLALADLNKAMQEIRDNPWLYRSRGLLYRSKGMNKLAIADFDQAIKLLPTEPEFYKLKSETPDP